MRFIYRLLAVVLIIVSFIAIVYCGVHATELEERRAAENMKTVETVNVWYNDDSLTDFFTNAAVSFHEKYADIRVVPTLVDNPDYLETINDASVSGEGYPDVFLVSNDSLEKAYLAGLATEVDSTTQVVNRAHFSDAAISAVTYRGRRVGYPMFFETSLLAYNKTYLEAWAEINNSGELEVNENLSVSDENEGENSETYEKEAHKTDYTYEDFVPKSFDDVLSFANSYNAPDGVDGVMKWDVSDIFYNYFFAGRYMNVGGENGDDPTNVDVYNAETISCLEVYQNLNQFFSIDATEAKYDRVLEEFMDGKFLFTIVTSDSIRTFEQHTEEMRAAAEEARTAADVEKEHSVYNPVEVDEDGNPIEAEPTELEMAAEEAESKVFEFGFARIPKIKDDFSAGSLSVTDALVVSSYSEHREAANKFAAFATCECASMIYPRTGKIAASTEALYEEKSPLRLFQSEYAESIPLPKIVEVSNFWVQLEVIFTRIWNGEDIQKLLDELDKQLCIQTDEETIEEQSNEEKK